MKVLFLDMDGVMNCVRTQHDAGAIAIDPFMVLLLHRIIEETGAKVVLSTSWRYSDELIKIIDERVLMGVGHLDITPFHGDHRGTEIQAWLEKHPEVTRYAILDDDPDAATVDNLNFFRTTFEKGLTEPTAQQVITHLNR